LLPPSSSSPGEIVLLNPVFFESKNQSEKLRKLEERRYSCDHPLWSVDSSHPDYSTQQDIFNLIGKPLVLDALEGLNCSLFAYGESLIASVSDGPRSNRVWKDLHDDGELLA
jgi:hypothetical protein